MNLVLYMVIPNSAGPCATLSGLTAASKFRMNTAVAPLGARKGHLPPYS